VHDPDDRVAMAPQSTSFSRLGCGIGLRREHYSYVLDRWLDDGLVVGFDTSATG